MWQYLFHPSVMTLESVIIEAGVGASAAGTSFMLRKCMNSLLLP
jgi:hypothetical protein